MNRGPWAWIVCTATLLGGCGALDMRSQSPEDETVDTVDQTKLVGDFVVPFGMYPVEVTGVGLVTGLPGTGSDPAPSSERGALMDEMQKLGVHNPNQLLASPNTDIVLVRGYLRPGIQESDRFDIEVRVPTRSENKGLRGGWLMQTRLSQMAAVGGAVRKGDFVAVAEGPILVDPSASGNGTVVMKGRGRILGGGASVTSRPLGLVIKSDQRNVVISSLIGTAINRRFHTFKQGVKTGTAKPKTDQFIELTLHPRYKDNVERYVRVIRALAVKETAEEQLNRMAVLERNLLDPISSAAAALKLEAIGKEAIPVLKKGLQSPDVEVRFYAAEALAYLDEKSAAAPLGEIAAGQPAFRAFALAALGAMDDFDAYEALRGLLSSQSVETRYGAFRALWSMNEHDAFIRDTKISSEFHYHVLDVEGPPLIHFTRSNRPEIVIFGRDHRFTPPLSVEAGPRILINSIDGERASVSRFVVGEPDQKRITSLDVDEVLRAVADLGGTYPDVVQALQQAKAAKSLSARLEMEAVPKAGRTYDRAAPTGEGNSPDAVATNESDDPGVTTTDREAFESSPATAADSLAESEKNEVDAPENDGLSRAWLSKIKFWE